MEKVKLDWFGGGGTLLLDSFVHGVKELFESGTVEDGGLGVGLLKVDFDHSLGFDSGGDGKREGGLGVDDLFLDDILAKDGGFFREFDGCKH